MTTVRYFVEPEVWKNEEAEVAEAVEATSGSWFLLEELEE